MVVELIGGPLDGAIVDGLSDTPSYMLINGHQDRPVYKASCCTRCAVSRQTMPYHFYGYEKQLIECEKAPIQKEIQN